VHTEPEADPDAEPLLLAFPLPLALTVVVVVFELNEYVGHEHVFIDTQPCGVLLHK
jgi:hypothetical protein